MNLKIKIIIGFVSLALIFVIYKVTTYKMKRSFNYSIEYKSKVEETSREMICEMVKKEYLKDPKSCD